jgi:hypothetical protein
MRRKKRAAPWLSDCCYHVSNTCYNPAGIFRFANMRQLAVERLRQLKDRYPIRFLNYLLYPDGYRFLIEAEHPGCITAALRAFHTETTSDYKSRKDWDGPVWRQRGTNIVLVQTGPMAVRCALDMDFAMVRPGSSSVYHPLLWKHSGHLELSELRKRYRIIDRDAVRRCFIDLPWADFREWYITASNSRWTSGEFAEEPWWDRSLVVGAQDLCETIADTLPMSWLDLKVYPPLQAVEGLDKTAVWTVSIARKRRADYLQALVPGHPA